MAIIFSLLKYRANFLIRYLLRNTTNQNVNLLPDEKPIARCYINEDGDERNACFITSQRFIIRRRNKLHEFPLNHLITINVRQKKMLFPIVFGGIIFSLSAVALSTSYYDPYLTLFGILLGLALLYWGFTGMKALSVLEQRAETNFFLTSHSHSLEAFLHFANTYIKGPNKPLEFYLPLPAGSSIIPAGTRLLLPEELGTLDKRVRVARIDPEKLSVAIKYQLDHSSGKHVPTLENDVRIEDLDVDD